MDGLPPAYWPWSFGSAFRLECESGGVCVLIRDIVMGLGDSKNRWGCGWNITIFDGKSFYFDWAIFNSSYVRNYQRVCKSMIEGSLETKVPTIWTDEKQHSQEEAEPGRNSDV